MKKLLFFLSVLSGVLYAQLPRHDANWVIGAQTSKTYLNFLQQPIGITTNHIGYGFSDNMACISDRAGALQLISNGFLIWDANGDTVATKLNTDDFLYSPQGGQFLYRMGTWIEDPADSNLYYYLHASYNISMRDTIPIAQSNNVYYTHLKKTSQGGWQVLAKNQVLIASDSAAKSQLLGGTMTVCRHANGRDWWLLVFEHFTKRYCRFLVTPTGIQNMGWVGEAGIFDITFTTPGGGGGTFTPDGKHYVSRTNWRFYSSLMRIWDFDRCTGLLSNERSWDLSADGELNSPIFQAYSASGRYMYDITPYKIWQWDLQAPNPYLSRIMVAEADTAGSCALAPGCLFTLSELAYDGKIYINTGSVGRYLAVINFPDSAGLACNVQKHVYDTGNPSGSYGMPNFPNYRLGPLVGSGCDTITSITKDVISSRTVRVYPNPARGEVTFTPPDPSYLQKEGSSVNPLLGGASVGNPLLGGAGVGEVVLHDILGREVLRKAARADTALSGVSSVTLDISPLPNGIYLWHCAGQSGKLVISR